MKRLPGPLLIVLLWLPTSACDALFNGFSIVPPPEPPRPPLVIDALEQLAHPPASDPGSIALLGGAPRLSAALVTVHGQVTPHIHHQSDETIYILQGHGDLLLDQKWRPVHAGMLIHVPMNVPHAFVNRAAGDTVALAIYTPPFVAGDRIPVAVAKRR